MFGETLSVYLHFNTCNLADYNKASVKISPSNYILSGFGSFHLNMEDFSLYDALSCSPKKENPSSDMMAEKFRINEELDLMVSHNKRTMKSVANLVLVVNKMRKSRAQCVSEFSDDELLSFIMDKVVEETIVEMKWNVSMEQRKVIFERANSLRQCVLTDMSQKKFILDSSCDGKQYKLQAITLKAGYNDLKVDFNMSRYIPSLQAERVDGSCILLTIKDKNMHLSCSWDDEKAVLNLEECCDENLQNICQDSDMDRFLFIKKTTGVSLNTFESVKYRGWFISTSYEDRNNSVEMCQGLANGTTTSKSTAVRVPEPTQQCATST